MLRRALLMMVTAMVMAAVAGCVDPRYTNQGGASWLSILAKFAQNPSDPAIGSLNPDEWQFLADNAPSAAAALGFSLPPEISNIPSLSDEQAQAIVDFLAANGVNNVSDLQELGRRIEEGQVVVPDIILDLVNQITGRTVPAE